MILLYADSLTFHSVKTFPKDCMGWINSLGVKPAHLISQMSQYWQKINKKCMIVQFIQFIKSSI